MITFSNLTTHVLINVDGKNNIVPKNGIYLQENQNGIISVYWGSQLIGVDNFNDFSPNSTSAATTIQAIAPLIFA